MSLTTIMNRRRQALLNSWKQDPLILVLVESMNQLRGVVTMLSLDEDAPTVGQVGSRSENNVAILNAPGNPDINASVWVKSSYRGYRKAYLAFIKQVYGVDATSSQMHGFDADHMLNKARSPSGGFIRLEAVPSSANQAWGRTFEKAAGFDDQRGRRTMDFTIAAKLAGLNAPTNKNDVRQIDAIVQYFERNLGLPKHEAEGFRQRMDFGYRQR